MSHIIPAPHGYTRRTRRAIGDAFAKAIQRVDPSQVNEETTRLLLEAGYDVNDDGIVSEPETETKAETWDERQVRIYGHVLCPCGSGLSPEECCG